MQKKQGAGLYYSFNSDLTDKLKKPNALTSYKDTLLLIANEAYISMLDMTKFPPLASDFQPNKIEVTQEPNWGSNSICAA